MKHENLQKYIEELISRGELIFSKEEVMFALGVSDAAIRNSIKRQVANKRLIRLLRGNYLVIPLEYQHLGFVPPELFVGDLMQRLGLKYYVCLLSAAAYYGATHQASQTFQVMVQKPINSIQLGAAQITFHVNKNLEKVPVQHIKTDRGPLTTSSPEATCLDILSYYQQSGNMNHIITVLEEMLDSLRPKELLRIMEHYPLLAIQRLGYMMEKLDCAALSEPLERYLSLKKPKVYSPLSPGSPNKSGEKVKKWHLVINEEIESDL